MAGFSLSEALEAVMNGGGPILGAEDAPDPSGLCDAGHGEEPELDGTFWGFDAGTYPLAITDSPGSAPLPITAAAMEASAAKRRRVVKGLPYWQRKAAQLNSLTHRTRTVLRDQWVDTFIRHHAEELAGMNYKEKVRHVHTRYWKAFSEGQRNAWYLHRIAPGEYAEPDLSGHDMGGTGAPAPGVGLPTAAPLEDAIPVEDRPHPDDDLHGDTQHRHMGYLLTWQGSWGCQEPEVCELVALAFTGGKLVEAVKRSVFFRRLWHQFQDFAVQRARQRHWPKYSGKCEVTLAAKDPSRHIVHFHLQVSDAQTRRKLTDKAFWAFDGFQPHIQPTSGRGRYLFKALATGHYYAQSPKIGSIFVFTNYPCFKECPVEQAYVFGLWKRYKMEDDIAQQEIIRARGRGTKGYLQEIDFNRRWRQAQLDKAERLLIEWTLPLRPSKCFKAVIEWMKLFSEEYGRATRFPFLVLNGESRLGKTRYAVQLWGKAQTLVVSCQGVLKPNLKDFTRTTRCIVYDEASHDMVVANKQVFQAGLDEVMLGQSACNEHAYSVWLYAVPMVVSTNNWLLGATEEDAAWLRKNSVVVDVTEPRWMEQNFFAVADGPLA